MSYHFGNEKDDRDADKFAGHSSDGPQRLQQDFHNDRIDRGRGSGGDGNGGGSGGNSGSRVGLHNYVHRHRRFYTYRSILELGLGGGNLPLDYARRCYLYMHIPLRKEEIRWESKVHTLIKIWKLLSTTPSSLSFKVTSPSKLPMPLSMPLTPV